MNIIPDERITRAAILTLQQAVDSLRDVETQVIGSRYGASSLGIRLRDVKNNVMYAYVTPNKVFKLNRLDGPAFIHHSDRNIFFILNRSYTPQEYQRNFIVKYIASLEFVDNKPIVCDGNYFLKNGGSITLSFSNRLVSLYCKDSGGTFHSFNDLPAVVDYGLEHAFKWYKHGKLHRDSGPAVIKKDGIVEYYINGKKYDEKSYEEFFKGIDEDQKDVLSDMMDSFDD